MTEVYGVMNCTMTDHLHINPNNPLFIYTCRARPSYISAFACELRNLLTQWARLMRTRC